MKLTAALAATAICMAGTTFAAPKFSGEAKSEYNTETEVMTLVVTPEVGMEWNNIDFTLDSDINLYNDEWVLGDTKPVLDFEASHMLQEKLELYGKVSYDLETEARGDIVVGAKLTF